MHRPRNASAQVRALRWLPLVPRVRECWLGGHESVNVNALHYRRLADMRERRLVGVAERSGLLQLPGRNPAPGRGRDQSRCASYADGRARGRDGNLRPCRGGLPTLGVEETPDV